MFYCNECGVKQGYPIDTPSRSTGCCELCGKPSVCNDIPCKNLPKHRKGGQSRKLKEEKLKNY